jgi:predicted pyridoxine 5'-phosphate oxidase superfamily flavin-nucleotide-binding protein
MTGDVSLRSIERCFTGVVPAVIATAAADGTPNVTYLSRVHLIDAERVALSNQFFSKTSRNLAENPHASLLIIDPVSYDEYRLTLVFERRERRGHVFERLRTDVDAIAAITGMQDVFNLRAADIYRVVDVHPMPANPHVECPASTDGPAPDAVAIAELSARLSRCSELDTLVGTMIDGLDHVLGYHHIHLLLLDESGRRLYTVASRGFDAESVGAEVLVGHGIIGTAAARGVAVRVGNLNQMDKYSRSIRRSWDESAEPDPGPALPMPGLPDARSRMAVPAMAFGHVVGVLAADSTEDIAFGPADEAALSVVAALFASAFETLRAEERDAQPDEARATSVAPSQPEVMTRIRHFPQDGSTFIDGDYVIKGVAGRILWSLVSQYDSDGRIEFTNRELRLDPSLELPGFKDNLESRLILLTRRLDERSAPIRLRKTGRGRFRIDVETSLRLDAVR